MADHSEVSGLKMFAPGLGLLRAFSFPLSILPALIAWSAVRGDTSSDSLLGCVCVVGAVLLHGTGNLLNDYFDHLYGVDIPQPDDRARPGRLLAGGSVSPSAVLILAVLMLLLAAPVGVFVWIRAGGMPLLFAACGAVAAYAYTGPPFRLKYKGLGEPVVFLVFGPLLMLGTAWTLTGSWQPRVLWLSLPVGCAVAAVLAAGNLRDVDEDSQAGIRTMAVALGTDAWRSVFVGLLVAPVAAVVLLGLVGVLPNASLLAPFVLVLSWPALSPILSPNRVPDADVRTAGYVSVLLAFLLVVVQFAT